MTNVFIGNPARWSLEHYAWVTAHLSHGTITDYVGAPDELPEGASVDDQPAAGRPRARGLRCLGCQAVLTFAETENED